ncbi:hypothetical protein FOWG_00600 [Fusarium oxysporum f. sp. lycopersici MN25]|nr:hypothetical protein FOWG_00600 [Fusarium oxysporum f. sp. lycopersici MN25]
MRLIHDLSGLSGQVKSSRRGSSGVDRDAGDGEIVTLQNHAYQLCDEIRCDTICDFRTSLRKYEQSQGGLFSYSKRRVYSYESSVQSGVDKKKKMARSHLRVLQRIAAVILGFAGKKSHRCLSGMDVTEESKFILCCAAGVHKVRGKWL